MSSSILRVEVTFVAVLDLTFPLSIKTEASPVRRKDPSKYTSEAGQSSSHSALGMVGRRLVLKLRRRKHMASGSILRRSCCCGGRDPRGEDLHVTKLLRLVGSIWPGVRERELVGELVSPPIQSSNLIRLQKSKGVSLNWPSADNLGTHFQTWRGPGVNVSGGPFAQLLRAGGITSISEWTNGKL